jgi:predicted nucleic acid-binding protein
MSRLVIFDSGFLMLLMQKNVSVRNDSTTGKALEFASERVDGLLQSFEKDKIKIGIPTPVLSEVLIGAGKALNQYVQKLSGQSCFKLLPFDEKAAIECALLADSENRALDAVATKAKLKFDRQILAIALSEGIETIYTDDDHLAKLAMRKGLAAIKIDEVPIPESVKQGTLEV